MGVQGLNLGQKVCLVVSKNNPILQTESHLLLILPLLTFWVLLMANKQNQKVNSSKQLIREPRG